MRFQRHAPTTLALVLISSLGILLSLGAKPKRISSVRNVSAVEVNHYTELGGHRIHSWCSLVNTSRTNPITIEQLLLVGDGGANQVLANLTTIAGTVIAPLGEVRILVDDSIAGVPSPLGRGASGVRNAIVRWTGPEDSMRLTALHENFRPSNSGQRSAWTSIGYTVAD